MVWMMMVMAAVAAPSAQGAAQGAAQAAQDRVGHAADLPQPSDAQPVGIINGEVADASVYPQAGAIVISSVITYAGREFPVVTPVCTGTLIAPDVVMVAAHCVDPLFLTTQGLNAADTVYHFSREPNLTQAIVRSELPADAVTAWDFVGHEGFSLAGMQLYVSENDDIGLLFLDTAILDTDPAVLPNADSAAQVVEGAEVAVVGWGLTEPVNPPAQPSLGQSGVKNWGWTVLGEVGPYEFQVGPDIDDVRKCNGDSGGPTFLPDLGDGYVHVIGVTSHSYDTTLCNTKGGVDTRVDAYVDWIDAEMRARCADGTRAWCEQEGALQAGWDQPTEPPAFGATTSTVEESGGGCDTAASGGPAGLVAVCLAVLGIFGVRREA